MKVIVREKAFFYLVFAVLVLVGLLALPGCRPAEDPSLAGTSWQLTEMDGSPLLEGTQITLLFEEEAANGNSSCNSYFGEYTINGDELQFGEMGMTLMFCENEGVMEQESTYHARLAEVQTFSLSGSQLTLQLSDGGELRFETFVQPEQ